MISRLSVPDAMGMAQAQGRKDGFLLPSALTLHLEILSIRQYKLPLYLMGIAVDQPIALCHFPFLFWAYADD